MFGTETKKNTAVSARQIRRIILEQSRRAHVGHIGSALSVADILSALYGQVLNIPSPDSPERDRFILSKGHAALGLYAALALKGFLPEAQLDTFCADASLLGVHPEHVLDGVDFSTGSLGQGLSIATGAALAARMQDSPRRVFVLLSDAECNEGSLWEAALFAAHHKLSNLVAVVDLNSQQALGYTDEVLRIPSMSKLWQAYGWDAQELDGHDSAQITRAIRDLDTASAPPHVLVAKTVFGKGVSFMERQIKWHYWPMSETEFKQALAEVSIS